MFLKGYEMTVSSDGQFCKGCALGKANKRSFSLRPNRPKVVGEQINANV